MKFVASIILAVLLASCQALTPPKTFLEQVAYAEVSSQSMLKSIGDLTCTKGFDKNGVCLEPGKPLHPQKALEMVNQIGAVRGGLKTAVQLPANGGLCLGATRTAEECLLAAQQILLQLETYLANQGR